MELNTFQHIDEFKDLCVNLELDLHLLKIEAQKLKEKINKQVLQFCETINKTVNELSSIQEKVKLIEASFEKNKDFASIIKAPLVNANDNSKLNVEQSCNSWGPVMAPVATPPISPLQSTSAYKAKLGKRRASPQLTTGRTDFKISPSSSKASVCSSSSKVSRSSDLPSEAYGSDEETYVEPLYDANKIYIEGLRQVVYEFEIRHCFKNYGKIISVEQIPPRNGKDGYAFVKFATTEARDDALNDKTPVYLDGYEVTVKKAYTKRKKRYFN